MPFSTATILTAGTNLFLQRSIGDRTLPIITVTVGVGGASIGGTSIPITALTAPTGLAYSAGQVVIQQGDRLTFNSTVPQTITVAQDVILGATTIIPAVVLTAALQAGNVAISNGFLAIQGADTADFKLGDKKVSTRSLSSGLWDENRKVMLSGTASVSGIYRVGDPAFDKIVLPACTDTFEVFCKIVYPDGDFRSGYAFLGDFQEPIKIDEIRKFSFSLNFNGQVTFGKTVL